MKAKDTRRGPRITRRTILYGAGATVVAVGAAWQMWPSGAGGSTASVTKDAIGDQVQTLPKGRLPVFAGTGEIRDLYRYAVDHGDELQYIPCFCGCGRFGHQSNRECYIKAVHPGGTLTFTSHAAT